MSIFGKQKSGGSPDKSEAVEPLKRSPRPARSAIEPLMIDRRPPHSIEAEQGVLGCILWDARQCLPMCVEQFNGIDSPWFDLRHEEIFKACVALQDAGKPVEQMSVIQQLRDVKLLEQMGGIVYLGALQDATPSAGNLIFYLDTVVKKAVLRKGINLCSEFIANAHDQEGEADALIDTLEREALQVRPVAGGNRKTAKQLVVAATAILERMFTSKGAVTGLPTGLVDLDKLLDGLHNELILIAGYPSTGKAQPLHSKVLTPTGWKRMGEIKVGDIVTGKDGLSKRVNGVFPQGVKRVVRFTTTDGASSECCKDHLWLTSSRRERQLHKPPQVKTAREIIATFKDNGRNSHAIPYCSPVEFTPVSVPKVSPWLVGLWLGDGVATGQVRIANPEKDIIERIFKSLPYSDTAIVTAGDEQHSCPVINVKRRKRNNMPSDFLQYLRGVGLGDVDSFTKFIPDELLYGSIHTRFEVLRGLMDSDGFVASGHYEISTASKKLCAGIVELARSLGGRVSFRKRGTHYVKDGIRHEAADSYRINIAFTNGLVPVTSEKHLARKTQLRRKTLRFIDSYKFVGKHQCQCISVDDGYYITDGYTVTHNTALAMNIVEHVVLSVGEPVGVLSLEMSDEQLMLRLQSSVARVDLRDIGRGVATENDFNALTRASGMLAKSSLHIQAAAGLSVDAARAIGRRMKQQHGIKLLVIDYMQLLHASSKSRREMSRAEELGAISGGCKEMAMELGIPVILLSQLTDEGKIYGSREPGHDADVVIKLKNDGDWMPRIQPVELLIEKQRNGPTGNVKLQFLKYITRFENATKQEDEI